MNKLNGFLVPFLPLCAHLIAQMILRAGPVLYHIRLRHLYGVTLDCEAHSYAAMSLLVVSEGGEI